MKKHLNTLLIISATIGIFSCSKKVTTFNFGKPYHEQNQSVVIKQEALNSEEEIILASTEENLTIAAPATIDISREVKSNAPSTITEKADKPSFKTKAVSKMLKKKIQKLEENQAISKNMKLGIIIAAISLVVLIVVAAGLLGGLSGLFWLLGGLGLLTGLIIILLAALDVI